MKKRILATLLAGLMLLSSAACATGDDPADTTASDQTQAVTEEVDDSFPDFGKQDHQGETLQMITWSSPEWYYVDSYSHAEQGTGILNDAVFEANTAVEEYLNIQMAMKTVPYIIDEIQPLIMAGDDTYQVCFMHPYQGISTFITENYALDLLELPDFSMDQPYWNTRVIESLMIHDHAYIGMGDLCRLSLNMLYVNKDLLKDVNIQVPYDSVRAGTWTLDELTSMTVGLYADNGDGARNPADTYGFTTQWDVNGAAFLEASDIYVVTRSAEDQFELSLYGDRLLDLYERLYNWTQSEDVYIWTYKAPDDVTVNFLDGHSYMTLTELGTQYLEASFSVGMLPMPKYDTAQESYAHVNWGHNLMVPGTVRNKDMVGQALELMGYYARNDIRTTYYDEVLQLRVSDAPDDREMVELIYDTAVFDPGIAFCDGSGHLFNLVYVTCLGIRNGDPNLASFYKKNYRPAQRHLDNLFKQ